jgi:hypothetical protein
MRHADSLDKIIQVYVAGLCREGFQYKGKMFEPKPVIVSPLLLRGHTCPTHCGACCGSFSLDFLPTETLTRQAQSRAVELHGRPVVVMSDQQTDVADSWCRHLDRANGRCRIYDRRPFTCDFELIRLITYSDRVLVIQKQYGRAWAMVRLDGEYGALCEMLPVDAEKIREVARKFERLELWTRHFGIRTCVPQIIDWVRSGDHSHPLRLPV